jgi:environmental stress-induced protein Ves
MAFTLLDPATARAMPWKNGGGTTLELAISPVGASLDDFAWRISSAQVALDGAFSSFPGVDRSLAVLAGNGLHLQRQDGQRQTLISGGAAVAFDGEEAISAHLQDGPITDLNLMTRRGAWNHELRSLWLDGEQTLRIDAEALLLWNTTSHSVRYQVSDGDRQVLPAHSGVLLENELGPLKLGCDHPSRLYVGRLCKSSA